MYFATANDCSYALHTVIEWFVIAQGDHHKAIDWKYKNALINKLRETHSQTMKSHTFDGNLLNSIVKYWIHLWHVVIWYVHFVNYYSTSQRKHIDVHKNHWILNGFAPGNSFSIITLVEWANRMFTNCSDNGHNLHMFILCNKNRLMHSALRTIEMIEWRPKQNVLNRFPIKSTN